MKLLFINNVFYPDHQGGAGVVMQRIVDFALKQGHEVVVITTSNQMTVETLRGVEGMYKTAKVYRLAPFNLEVYQRLNHLAYWMRAFWHGLDALNLHSYYDVQWILEKEQPDMILTHNLKGIGYLVPAAIRKYCANRKAKCTWIHTLHDAQLIYPSGQVVSGDVSVLEKTRLQQWYMSLCRRLFKSPDNVISPSQFLLDMHIDNGFFENAQNEVLRNPIDTSVKVKATAWRRPLELLYVGAIEKSKGVFWLIKQLKDVENIHVTVIGDGAEAKKCERQAAKLDFLTYTGPLSNDELTPYFEKAHFLVMPSLVAENSPTVLAEAMVHNTPVVCAQSGGAPEVIPKGAGYVYNDSKDFRRILSDIQSLRKSEYEDMVKAAYAGRTQFDIEEYALSVFRDS